MSRPWISHREGADWGQGPPLATDEHGWITRLEPGCSAETFVCSIGGGHYPGGDYTVLYDGEGTLECAMAAVEVVSRSPGRLVVRVEPARGRDPVRLLATDPDDHVRNIRVLMPGFEETYRENPWHPCFLDRWRGVACLRFMDLMMTNGSDQGSWSDRPTVADATFAEKGVPVELLVDLANRLDADPWFCMPHRANDDYVTNFARLVRDGLRPGLRAWVEYSNEVWNGGFAQHRYAAERGRALGLGDEPWQAACRYTAERSLAIFDLWERAFGGRERIVRVLAAQAANPEVARQILGFRDAGRHADALAIAPYMSVNVPADPSSPLNAGVVADWPVETILDHVERVALPEAIRAVESHEAIADRQRPPSGRLRGRPAPRRGRRRRERRSADRPADGGQPPPEDGRSLRSLPGRLGRGRRRPDLPVFQRHRLVEVGELGPPRIRRRGPGRVAEVRGDRPLGRGPRSADRALRPGPGPALFGAIGAPFAPDRSGRTAVVPRSGPGRRPSPVCTLRPIRTPRRGT